MEAAREEPSLSWNGQGNSMGQEEAQLDRRGLREGKDRRGRQSTTGTGQEGSCNRRKERTAARTKGNGSGPSCSTGRVSGEEGRSHTRLGIGRAAEEQCVGGNRGGREMGEQESLAGA